MGTGTAFQNYVKEFSNLDKATQQAVLSSGLLSKAQKEQLISQLELSASTATLTAEQVQERLATELNSEADAKALLTKSACEFLISLSLNLNMLLNINLNI